MPIFRKPAVLVAALMACTVLAGCGADGPSNSTIRQLVRADVKQTMLQTNSVMNVMNQPVCCGVAGNDTTSSDHLTPDEQTRLANLKIEVGSKTRQADGGYDVVMIVDGRTFIEKFIKAANGWHMMDDTGS